MYYAIDFSVVAGSAVLLSNNVSRLLVTNGVCPLVDCCCKESFEVFTAVIVSQLMYAFVCKSPAWKFVPCGSHGLYEVKYLRLVHPG